MRDPNNIGDITSEYAPGIADRDVFGDPTKKLIPGQLATYVLQHHVTKRNPGRSHADLRIGTPSTNLFSWAIPGAKLPKPGEQTLAPATFLHAHQYANFVGNIDSGYGAGTVTRADLGQALIRKVTPNSIHFTLAHTRVPTRYALVNIGGRRGKDWLLINKAMPKSITGVGDKPKYKLIQAADLDEAVGKAQEVQAKIDGSHMVYDMGEGGQMEAYSVNPRVTGEPIPHSERLGITDVKVPGESGTTLRGEAYAVDRAGKSIPFSQISGILNATIARAIDTQKSKKLRMQNALFDIIRHRGKAVGHLPYAERKQLLTGIVGKLPADKFHMPASANTPEEKAKLVTDVRTGRNPTTSEGLILHTDGDIQKFKERQETTGYITGVFPGEGKRGKTVGGLTFSLEPGGKESGQVGSGLSDQQLQEIAEHPENFVGKPIRLYYQEQFKTGKLRAPVFGGWETDKPELGKAAMQKDAIIKLEGGKFKLYTHDGRKVLGTHPSHASALSQEHAIQAHKHGSVKQATWKQEMLRSLLSAAPAEAILAGRGIQSGHANTTANETIGDESPTLLRPWGAPPKTDFVYNLAQMRRYLNRREIPPDEQKRMLAAAAATLGTVTNATTFRVPTDKGVRSLVAIAQGTPKKLYKHEYGHAQQIQGGMIPSNLRDTLGALLLGATLSPKYRREEQAWDLSGVPEGDPVRETALNTYRRGIQTAVDPIRYGVPAYLGIRYGQAHPERIKAVALQLKGLLLGLAKRGQAAPIYSIPHMKWVPDSPIPSLTDVTNNPTGAYTSTVSRVVDAIKNDSPRLYKLFGQRTGIESKLMNLYTNQATGQSAKDELNRMALNVVNKVQDKPTVSNVINTAAKEVPYPVQQQVATALGGK